jgi:hypothetical protein
MHLEYSGVRASFPRVGQEFQGFQNCRFATSYMQFYIARMLGTPAADMRGADNYLLHM